MQHKTRGKGTSQGATHGAQEASCHVRNPVSEQLAIQLDVVFFERYAECGYLYSWQPSKSRFEGANES